MIEAVSRTCKTMADGTLRITFDVPPKSAKDAFGLFGEPDVPVVLARLTQEAAQAAAQASVISEHQKGGALAKLAGMWSGESKFHEWINSFTVGGIHSPEGAASFVRNICGIESRAELDHSANAARLFNEKIRVPYMAWLKENE